MRAFFLAAIGFCLFLIVMDAHATFMARDSKGNTVKLLMTPCTVHPWLKRFREAEMVYNETPYKACWARIGDVVLVIDEAGDVSPLSMEVFKKEVET